jgi:hypothetical protein
MNTDTNELIDVDQEIAFRQLAQQAELQSMERTARALAPKPSAKATARAVKRQLGRENFTPVPQELEHAAKCALQGQTRCVVSRISRGKLSKWAAAQRRNR